MVQEYVRYFNQLRPHQGIGQQRPVPSALVGTTWGPVQAVPILGGLHHDYQRVA